MNRPEAARSLFSDGYNCAQAIAAAFCSTVGMDQDTALKISCGFGAGMGRSQEVCGAVGGSILILGLRYGRGEGQDKSRTETTYQKTRELIERFQERQGSPVCRDLLNGCDLRTPEGQHQFREEGLYNRVCLQCVSTAADILEDILHNQN